jgi:NAD(P)H dehydrogenase (quinone)
MQRAITQVRRPALQRAFSQLANGKTKKFVLTGADGNLGRVAADYMVEIAKPEEQVVITSYDLKTLPAESIKRWESKGAIVTKADYDDIEGMKKVFDGAEAVALISTWRFGMGRRIQAKAVCDAAKAVGVKRACYTSFVGAGIETDVEEEIPFLPRDHHFIEKIVKESGLDYNIQRNWLYMDNIPTLFAPSWKFCGDKWLSNSHGTPGAYVAREDCGRVLAAILLGRGEPNKVYDVTGPKSVTQQEVFDWMCQVTGYKGELVDMTDEELTQWWLDRGLPTDMATGDFSQLPMKLCIGDAICCGEMLGNGAMINTSDTVEKLTGRKPLHFQQVLLKYKGLFPKPE